VTDRAVGRLLTLGLAAAGLLLAVVGMSDAARAATSTVSIVGLSFQPGTVNVNVGDTVTWQNDDFQSHTTTSSAPLWDSGTLGSGQTFSFTFPSAGTFNYVCTIHFGMAGTVIVGGGGPTPTHTPTPTLTPSLTPTPTPTPTQALPTGPNVRLSVARDGANRLLVTVSARPGQTLDRLAWTLPANAIAETVGGEALPTGIILPAGTSSTTFRLRRVSGQSVTLPIVVTGSFGTWRTFVGGGPSAW
jgi:plastocyanin